MYKDPPQTTMALLREFEQKYMKMAQALPLPLYIMIEKLHDAASSAMGSSLTKLYA